MSDKSWRNAVSRLRALLAELSLDPDVRREVERCLRDLERAREAGDEPGRLDAVARASFLLARVWRI